MSFGFQLFDENGGLALDDRSFSIIGRDIVLSGKGSFPLYPEFVALGVSGAQLVGKGLHWHISSNSVVYEVVNGGSLIAVVFEYSSKSVAYPAVGLEVFSESGLKIFSSGDRHFEIVSSLSIKTAGGTLHKEPLDRGMIYILHSLFTFRIGAFPTGTGGVWLGNIMGVDYLTATSTSLDFGLYETWRMPEYVQRPVFQYTSQLLRVRSK